MAALNGFYELGHIGYREMSSPRRSIATSPTGRRRREEESSRPAPATVISPVNKKEKRKSAQKTTCPANKEKPFEIKKKKKVSGSMTGRTSSLHIVAWKGTSAHKRRKKRKKGKLARQNYRKLLYRAMDGLNEHGEREKERAATPSPFPH